MLLLAPQVEAVLIHSGAEWMPSFIELLQSKLTAISDPVLQKMMATADRRPDGTVHRLP